MSIVYEINRGINKPIEFKGLKAQYIWYLGAGLGLLLILFSISYLAGVNLYLLIGVIGVLGCGLFSQVYRLSRTYGVHGLMKLAASKRVPSAISSSSRLLFIRLRKS
ncbi:DUF4133 domain-containing protein [Chitinophaga rhizosphaerae]|uniref:DUF4133 domain-containing protein n=1 Tax=Chitinophaga rhizosphaerae TaxID=1864947 RepID=UPI000F8102A5|nr:DUF4133 domain-containing protein [Chitinophaga rhizosphaerae]